MAKFGWSLLGEEPEAPDHCACPHCSSRLREKHDRAEPWWDWQPFDPSIGHQGNRVGLKKTRLNPTTQKIEYLADAGSTLYWNCPNCGQEIPDGRIKPIYWDAIDDDFNLLHISDINERYQSYAEWEAAASNGDRPRDTTGLPPEVIDLMAQRGFEISGDWYWVERGIVPEDGDDMETWTNGLGVYLVYTYGDGIQTVNLTMAQISKPSGSNADGVSA